MAYLPINLIVQQVALIYSRRFDLRRKELVGGPESNASTPPVVKWVTDEDDFPEGSDRGDYPKGLVTFDPERTFERREQDSGDTSEIGIRVAIYFDPGSMSAGDMKARACNYLDAIAWTAYRESRAKSPINDTVLPGLFRILPKTGRVGQIKAPDLQGAEVECVVIVDQQFTGAL